MKFKENIFEYINGEKFSNGLTVNIAKPERYILNRLDLIDSLVKNKNVIHLGCCDHIPLIKEKQRKGIWLHERITENSKKTLGIDINNDGINYLKKEMNYNNVVCADITKDEIQELEKSQWDYIVVGEILEHVDNPTLFLKTIAEKYKGKISNFIITVPNAFSLTNFNAAKKGNEIINSDHRFWFSPYTMAKIGYQAGLRLNEFFFVQDSYFNKTGIRTKLLVIPYLKNRFRKRLLLKNPAFREGILCVFNYL